MAERLGGEPAAVVEGEPPASTGVEQPAVALGSTTTATLSWFFAAARTIAGPPMSICSTHSSGVAPEATVGGERVEVGHEQVERGDAQLVELRAVLGAAGVGEQPGVHVRVQRLDPAVEALGEAGELLDRR